MEERKRKVDVEALTLEQAEELSQLISTKVQNLAAKAQDDINRILNIYGMKGTIQLQIDQFASEE